MTTSSAIITGGSAGIGLAIGHMLTERGFSVTLAARRADRLEAAAAALRDAGREVSTHAVDASDPDGVQQLVAGHIERYGGLDVVAANAGTGSPGPAAASRMKDLERMTRVNVYAPFLLAGETLAHLRTRAAEGGRPWFVITSSMAGIWPMMGFAGYSATKAAAVSLAKSISGEEQATGVRACAICPGFVDTDLAAWTHDSVPPQTMLVPEDAAAAVAFLLDLSPNALVPELVMHRRGAPAFTA